MRSEDLDRLSRPYPQGSLRPDRRLADALGVRLEALERLDDAIASDRDTEQLGIGWWAPHPGTARRILISDHLIQCVATMPRNLVAAQLHLREFLDAWEQEGRFLVRAVTLGRDDRPQITLPRRARPFDDLPNAMANLHLAGFFQSAISTLDCLGAVIVGVLALPISIVYADLVSVRKALDGARRRATRGQCLQDDFRQRFENSAAAAGPAGWLSWTLDFRNMLTHRARRLQMSQLRPGHTLYGPSGQPVLHTEVIPHLARDPGLSDVEALLHRSSDTLVLAERAETSLAGVLGSILALTSASCTELLAVWNARREEPGLLQQPVEQWPRGAAKPAFDFQGYAPGTVLFDGQQFVTGPDTMPRLRSAALDDAQRHRWGTFD